MIDHTYTGQVLYHYANEDALLGILKTRCIWATAIKDLADETELDYGRDLVAHRFDLEAKRSTRTDAPKLKVCADCTRALPYISEMIKCAGHEPSDNANVNWYVACFSEEKDALPLWRGFTRDCTGYALGMRYKRPESPLSDIGHYAPKRVIYSQRRQQSVICNTVARARQMLDDPLPLNWTMALETIFTLKNRLFKSEQEWRVIWTQFEHPAGGGGDHNIGLKQGISDPLDVYKRRGVEGRSIHYVKLPLSDWELVEIICGPRAQLGPASHEIHDGIKAFGCQPGNVHVAKSAYRLWR